MDSAQQQIVLFNLEMPAKNIKKAEYGKHTPCSIKRILNNWKQFYYKKKQQADLCGGSHLTSPCYVLEWPHLDIGFAGTIST